MVSSSEDLASRQKKRWRSWRQTWALSLGVGLNWPVDGNGFPLTQFVTPLSSGNISIPLPSRHPRKDWWAHSHWTPSWPISTISLIPHNNQRSLLFYPFCRWAGWGCKMLRAENFTWCDESDCICLGAHVLAFILIPCVKGVHPFFPTTQKNGW